MAFVLKLRRIDIKTGGDTRVVVLRGHDATAFGINPGDRLQLRYRQQRVWAVADITHHSIRHGEIGLFDEVWRLLKPKDGDPLSIEVVTRPPSIAAINRKLLGQTLSRTDIRNIITDIVSHRLSSVETTYFVASGYVKPYTTRELVWMVEAMAETGDMFLWPSKSVVDKHSVGGLAGNRTTMVAIPIAGSLGLLVPKTSSRAITSPAGTADTMEVLAPVTFRPNDVRRIVRQAGACLIWGGGLSIAPADDIIIRLSRPLSLEPYDKMIVSILAKKVAMGVKFLVIDMPFGSGTKIPNRATAKRLAKRFQAVAKAFRITIRVRFDQARQPIGQGIGPALEARDVLRVLQQHPLRPRDLEQKAIDLSADMLALSKKMNIDRAKELSRKALRSGRAWKTMQRIISAQGGDPDIVADAVALGAKTHRFIAPRNGRVRAIYNRAVDEIARTLGAPEHKLAGIYLHRKLGQKVRKGDKLFTLYSYSTERIRLAEAALALHPVVLIG